jgi:hypothetical protein
MLRKGIKMNEKTVLRTKLLTDIIAVALLDKVHLGQPILLL